MSQIQYYTPSIIKSSKISTNDVITSTTLTNTEHFLSMEGNFDFDIEKPVRVIDDEIEVNEDLLKEDQIYPIIYRGKQYYVRRFNGATEIFQFKG